MRSRVGQPFRRFWLVRMLECCGAGSDAGRILPAAQRQVEGVQRRAWPLAGDLVEPRVGLMQHGKQKERGIPRSGGCAAEPAALGLQHVRGGAPAPLSAVLADGNCETAWPRQVLRARLRSPRRGIPRSFCHTSQMNHDGCAAVKSRQPCWNAPLIPIPLLPGLPSS